MRIILDAMSGDKAPESVVLGGLDAAAEFGVDVSFVGREDVIAPLLGGAAAEIINCAEVVTMEDDPTTVLREKKDSSMAVGLRRLAEGGGDAFVSAGNTGALLSGATLIVKRIRGIRRAAMAPVLPNGHGGFMLVDCGANAECTPEYLLQFAYMGSYYMQSSTGIESPRVGLLNIGTEASKGTALQRETFEILSRAGEKGRINFIGNVEAHGAFSGEIDVLVTDGFTGNVMLKAVEGTAGFLMTELGKVFAKGDQNQLAASMLKDDIRHMRGLLDPSEIGGTILLGISKPVIKAHGSSDARAIRSAVMQAVTVVRAELTDNIARDVEQMTVSNSEL